MRVFNVYEVMEELEPGESFVAVESSEDPKYFYNTIRAILKNSGINDFDPDPLIALDMVIYKHNCELISQGYSWLIVKRPKDEHRAR